MSHYFASILKKYYSSILLRYGLNIFNEKILFLGNQFYYNANDLEGWI